MGTVKVKYNDFYTEHEVASLTTRKYVVMELEDENIFCLGITNNYHEAIGIMMQDIWERIEDGIDNPDVTYEIDKVPTYLDSECGEYLNLIYTRKNWSHVHNTQYRIMYYDEEVK